MNSQIPHTTPTFAELRSAVDNAADERARVDALIELAWAQRFEGGGDTREEIAQLLQRSESLDAVIRSRVEFVWAILTMHDEGASANATLSASQQALTDFRARGSSIWIARTLNVIGGQLHRVGDYAGALEAFDEAQPIFERADDRPAQAIINFNIGVVLSSLGQQREAIERLLESVDMYAELADHAKRARAHTQLAIEYQRIGELATSVERYLLAISVYDEIGDERGSAAALQGLGRLQVSMGDVEAGVEKIKRSAAVLEQGGDLWTSYQSLMNMVRVYEQTGDSIAQLETLERAVDMTRGGDRPDFHGGTLYALANAYLTTGDIEKAETLLQESRKLNETIDYRAGILQATFGLGKVAEARGRHEETCEFAERALVLATELEAIPSMRDCHEMLAAQKYKLGQYKEAFDHQQKMHELTSQMGEAEVRAKVQSLESARKLEVARKESEIERLRNVELASAHADLANAHAELQRAHEQLKHAQTQLVHAEKMASLGQLTAGIAHEINNPVNYITASLPSVLRDLDELMPYTSDHTDVAEIAHEMRQLIHTSQEGARRIAEIVKGLRTFSRLDEDELKSVDLHSGIESTLDLLKPRLNGVVVSKSFGDIPHVECNAGQINQAFMNVLTNALDAVDGRGRIEVSTCVVDEHVHISIRDDGAGIAEEHIPHIFEPFYTTKAVGSGQGLGLAITNSIVEQHGGSITIDTAHGNGCTVTIILPRKRHE